MMIDGEVIPETRSCTRCGQHVRIERLDKQCDDCKSVNVFRPVEVSDRGFARVDPGYEVIIHYRKRARHCPTRATLNSLKLPYLILTGTDDSYDVAYAMSLHRDTETPIEWPIVLITHNGEYLEHWEGFRLADLNRIPADRKRILGIGDEPNPQDSPEQTISGVPDDLKVAA